MQMTGTFTSETVWAILDGLREGILIIEKDGAVVFTNQAAKEILLLDEPVTFATISNIFPSSLDKYQSYTSTTPTAFSCNIKKIIAQLT